MTGMFLKLRTLFRMGRVAIHLAGGAAVTLATTPPVARQWRPALKQRWSRQLLHVLGIQLDIRGTPAATMRVANHISWLDIFAINAVSPAAFVAKDDVLKWPLIGWMSTHAGTIFIRRGSRRAAYDIAYELAACLSSGGNMVTFPEGTTSDGRQVLAFHGALLEGAILAGVPVQPVALCYQTPDESPAQAPVYCGETSLMASMWRIAAANGLVARLEFLAARPSAGGHRRELAAGLRADIVTALPLLRETPVLRSM